MLWTQECLREAWDVQAVRQFNVVCCTAVIVDFETEGASPFGDKSTGNARDGSSLRQLEVLEAFFSS